MRSSGSILEACARLERPAVLATVVRVQGSAYRRPGARMLIDAAGSACGMVSGGCLEADLAERARSVLERRESETIVYDMRSPDDIVWGLGLGCDGEVRVLLEWIDPQRLPGWCSFATAARARRSNIALTTVFEAPQGVAVGARLWTDGTQVHGGSGAVALDRALADSSRLALRAGRSCNEEWKVDGAQFAGFVEVVRPPVRLLVFGAGSDAEPLVDQAAALGWVVEVHDHRESFLSAVHFPSAHALHCIDPARLDPQRLRVDDRTAVLLMTHHFLNDLAVLGALLELPVAYLGVLGPKRRLRHLVEELGSQGKVPTEIARARLHGPVGLDIGSETPAEIALSALAEIQAVMAGRSGGFLRDGDQPLHGDSR